MEPAGKWCCPKVINTLTVHSWHCLCQWCVSYHILCYDLCECDESLCGSLNTEILTKHRWLEQTGFVPSMWPGFHFSNLRSCSLFLWAAACLVCIHVHMQAGERMLSLPIGLLQETDVGKTTVKLLKNARAVSFKVYILGPFTLQMQNWMLSQIFP